jgi:hypothetical protein
MKTLEMVAREMGCSPEDARRVFQASRLGADPVDGEMDDLTANQLGILLQLGATALETNPGRRALKSEPIARLRNGSIEVREGQVNGDQTPLSKPTISGNALLGPFNGDPSTAFHLWSDIDMGRAIPALKAILLEEDWAYAGTDPRRKPERPLPVLHSHVKLTFYRVWREGKVFVSPRAPGPVLAAYNTGLVDRFHTPVFGLFEKGESALREGGPWHFRSFCVPGQDRDGKLLARAFPSLPAAADYLSPAENLVFRPIGGGLYVDWEHIIRENTARIPAGLLRGCAVDASDPKAVSAAIQASPALARELRAAYAAALERALRRATWDYRYCVPSYSPGDDKVVLMLPLGIEGEDQIDGALVLDRTATGSYLAPTVLPLWQAFNNARLVSQVHDAWLLEAQG